MSWLDSMYFKKLSAGEFLNGFDYLLSAIWIKSHNKF